MTDLYIENLIAASKSLLALSKQGKGSRPSRVHARELLLAIGALAIEGRTKEAKEAISGLLPTLERLGDAWLEAIGQEMDLACSEHIQGVDPRYLQHARFDFSYVIEARQRLEMRLRALDVLGVDADERALDQVAEADDRLRPYLEARDQEGQ